MKKIFLALLILSGFVATAQPSNYLNIRSRYNLIAGKFDSTLHIPKGTTPGLFTGGWTGSGALFYKTSDSSVYVYTGSQWIPLGVDTSGSFITSVYRKTGTDSVFYVKGGTHTFAFTDSIGGAGGGVTSVGSGYGLSGGPITTSGTLLVDSATLANHFLRRQDSLTASNLLGYVTRQVLADSTNAIRSNNSYISIDKTYDSLAWARNDSTLLVKSLRVQLNGSTVTPTTTDSTVSYNISSLVAADTTNKYVTSVYRKTASDSVFYVKGGTHTFAFIDSTGGAGASPAGNYGNIQLNRNGSFATPASDSLDFDAGLNIKGALTATAIPTGGVAADSLVVITSAGAFKKRNASAFISGTGTTGQFALFNGTNSIYSSSKFNYSDALYPTMSIIGSDPVFYIGPSTTLTNNPGYGHGAGAAIYGGATYKSIQLVDQISGGTQMARFYNSGGTIYNNLNGLITSNTLSSPSNYQGSFNIQRTVPYSSGLNFHGYTDQTVFNAQSTAFNSFGSFVTFGNDRFTQNHYAAFQSVWYKDSSNQIGKVYDFVSAVSEHREGTIDTLFRFKVFPVTVSVGATLNVEYGLHIPTGSATTKYGGYIEDNLGVGDNTPDSSGTFERGLWGKRGVRFSGLPTAKKLKQVYWDTDGTLSVGDTTKYLTEGTYTPTLTNTTNVAASTAYTTYYVREGDWVHVWGTVDIDATSATTITEIDMTLPTTTTFTNIYDLSGTAAHEDNTSVQIKANTTNGKAMWRFTPQSASNNKYSFHLSYKHVTP